MPIFSEDGLSLSFTTEIGLRYTIEVSEDLLTWQLLTTRQGTGGPLSITDENAAPEGQRFYRAVQAE